jgi:hypothetical protein
MSLERMDGVGPMLGLGNVDLRVAFLAKCTYCMMCYMREERCYVFRLVFVCCMSAYPCLLCERKASGSSCKKVL